MKTIGLFEAKTNLSKIAETVARTGQAVTLTRRGEPFVDLVPHVSDKAKRLSQKEVIAEILAFRKTLKLPKITAAEIKADIEQGRR